MTIERLDEARRRISPWLVYGEDVLYLITGGLLGLTAIWLLFQTTRILFTALGAGTFLASSLEILDALLLVLMLIELMHTIRVSLEAHALVPEPFLIVALIAGVRRVLILTTEASQYIQTDAERFQMALLELALLTAYFLVITFAIAWLRRHQVSSDRSAVPKARA